MTNIHHVTDWAFYAENADGTVVANAKKIGTGWLVRSRVGYVWPSVWAMAKPGQMANVKVVKTKAQAEKLAKSLCK